MRRIYLILSLLSVFAIPVAAHASSELLTITGNSETWTFVLPSAPTVASSGTAFFELTGIAATGTLTSSSDDLDFFDTSAGGGMSTFEGLNFFGTQLFGGTTSNPTFGIGSGSGLTDGTADGFTYSYAFTDASSTPEPSSLVLLGTGALSLAVAFRRRLLGA